MLTLFLRRVAVMVFQTAESSVKETPCINAASTFEVVNNDEDIDFSYVGTDRQRCDPFTNSLIVHQWQHAFKLSDLFHFQNATHVPHDVTSAPLRMIDVSAAGC